MKLNRKYESWLHIQEESCLMGLLKTHNTQTQTAKMKIKTLEFLCAELCAFTLITAGLTGKCVFIQI